MKKPVHINIVGRKKSGKTSLIQALTRELTANGISVGTVKHTSHDHEFDIIGTDSWKHRQAGSQTTIILSHSNWVCYSQKPLEDQLKKWMDTIFQGNDIVLWEGDRNTPNKKIECLRPNEKPLSADNQQLLAVVANHEIQDKSKHYKFDEADHLRQYIIKVFNLPGGKL